MSPRTAQEVHIVPLGWEYDRAVLPFKPIDGVPTFRPHRVHIIVAGSENDGGYPKRVAKVLRSLMEVETRSVRRVDHAGNMVEFEAVLRETSELIVREFRSGNRVFVNIAAGSKISAVAAGMAVMAHKEHGPVEAYYVVPEGYSKTEKDKEDHGIAWGLKDVVPVDMGSLHMPRPEEHALLRAAALSGSGWVDYRELIQRVQDDHRLGFLQIIGPSTKPKKDRNSWNNATTRLKRSFIDPMARQGLVEIQAVGTKRQVRLTSRGALIAQICDPQEVHNIHNVRVDNAK